jgi:CRISPR-associated protein Cmr5
MKSTIDQKRAADALQKIKAIKDKEHELYVSYVSALPATIVMNGLGQALTMLLAKDKGEKKSAHYFIFAHLTTWLGSQIKELKSEEPTGVLQRLLENDQSVYVRAQVESMAYLNWLKQFARAYLRGE